MEFEGIIPKVRRPIDQDKLASYCRKFADVLSDKSWQFNDVLGAHIQREVRRIVVTGESIGDARLHSARIHKVMLDFWADKDEADFDDEDNILRYEEHYTLSASLTEEVAPVDLPEWVIESLSQNVEFQKNLENSNEQPEIDLEKVDSFIYDKTTVMRYVIDEEGFIEDFAIICRYECNGQVIDTREYSWSDTIIEAIGTSTWRSDTKEKENDTQLSESDIISFQDHFDAVMQQIVEEDERVRIDEQFRKLESDELESRSEEDWQLHYTRAFGMLALNAERFIGMRIK